MEAAAALAVFCSLRVVDVAGSSTMREIARPWILDFIAAIFGAYNAEQGRRLIREFLPLIAKKNAKSTLSALIMITALIRNWRHSAEFYSWRPRSRSPTTAFSRPATPSGPIQSFPSFCTRRSTSAASRIARPARSSRSAPPIPKPSRAKRRPASSSTSFGCSASR